MLVMALAPKDIGARIKQARKAKGWTQLEFALSANVSPSSVARWEAGKLPPVRELIRLAELLEVSTDELVEPEPTAPRDEVVERLERIEQVLEALVALAERDAQAAQAR